LSPVLGETVRDNQKRIVEVLIDIENELRYCQPRGRDVGVPCGNEAKVKGKLRMPQ
jgi:hypothetical protein